MFRKNGTIRWFLSIFLAEAIFLSPFASYAAQSVASERAATPSVAAGGVSWQAYLEQNLPPTVGTSERAQITKLMEGLEQSGRKAHALVAENGVLPTEAAKSVAPEVQSALSELVQIGEKLDGEAQTTGTPQETPASSEPANQVPAPSAESLKADIAGLNGEIATLEKELTEAYGLKARIQEVKDRKVYATSDTEKKSLDAERRALEQGVKRTEQERKNIERDQKNLDKKIKSALKKIAAAEMKGNDTSALSAEFERLEENLVAKRSLWLDAEWRINGNPAYPFSTTLGTIAKLRQELIGKEKELTEAFPPSEEPIGVVSSTLPPFEQLAKIVTLPEKSVRDISLASPLSADKSLIEAFRQEMKKTRELKKRNLEVAKEALETEKKTLQRQQKELLTREGPQGLEKNGVGIECRILAIDTALAIYPVKDVALDRAYDNFEAKLDFFANWPAKYAEIQAKLADNSIYAEQFMDYPLIGTRDLGVGNQQDDVRAGMEDERQIKEEMERMLGYFPEEIKDPKVVAYFRTLTDLMQRSSDLKVPLRVKVLKTPEVNAFALRGGAVYFFAGLLVADKLMAEAYKKKGLERHASPVTEDMVFGIFAHETAHVTLRHTHRIMKPVTIASILMQAAQIAIMFGSLGFGMLAYLIYQYGMPAIGLLISLKLLGISREHETEADIVGAQYAWKAGFDPRGSVDFHEWLATNVGYVRGAGYFQTHPAAYSRIWNLEKTLAVLPASQDEKRVSSQEFEEIRQIIWDLIREKELEDKIEAESRPSLLAKEKEAAKKRAERCKAYSGEQSSQDPFDETPFKTPLFAPFALTGAFCSE